MLYLTMIRLFIDKRIQVQLVHPYKRKEKCEESLDDEAGLDQNRNRILINFYYKL